MSGTRYPSEEGIPPGNHRSGDNDPEAAGAECPLSDGARVMPLSDLGASDADSAIEIVHHESARFYELLESGTSLALLVYEQGPRQTSITHAMVRDDQRGRGLGTTLIATVLPHLAGSGARVTNYCESVERFLQKHPSFQSLVERRC